MKTTGSRASAVSQTRGFGDLLYDKAGARPSLDLDFAGTSSLRDKITGEYLVDHTRASNGTYIDSEGLVKEGTTNLALYSEDFANAGWTKNSLSVASETIPAPIGNGVAQKLVLSTSNMESRLLQSYTADNTVHTTSVYVKAAGVRYVHFRVGASASNYGHGFDLQEGVAITGVYGGGATAMTSISHSIEDVGDGWYRISVTGTNGSGLRYFLPAISTSATSSISAGDGTIGVYFYGFQHVKGTEAGEYVKTTSTANSAPRFTHERVETGNLLAPSQSFVTGWDTGNLTTVTDYFAEAPDGTFTASRLVMGNTGGTYHRKTGITFDTTKTYTFSVYAKKHGTSDKLKLEIWGSGNTIVHTITDEWARYELTFTPTSSSTYVGFNEPPQVGCDILIWGAQLEEADSATTYAPSIDTFTSRASSATYVDSAGLVKTAALNYILNSDAPSHHVHTTVASWLTTLSYPSSSPTTDGPFGTNQKVKKVVITSDKPDFTQYGSASLGTLTSDQKIRIGAENGGSSIGGGIANQTFTWSFYYRSLSGDRRFSAATGADANRNYAQLTATSEWQRAEVSGSRSDTLNILDLFYLFNGAADLEFASFQVEKGRKASDYVLTEQTGNNSPSGVNTSAQARYSHDPETLTPTGLYLEPQGINHAKHLSSAYTAPSNLLNPSGGYGAFSLSSANNQYFYLNNFTPVNGQNITVSYWAKLRPDATINSIIKLKPYRWNSSVGGQGEYYIDLSDGTIASVTLNGGNNPNTATADNTTITPYPNGWYRITHKIPMDSTWTSAANFGFIQYNGGHVNARHDVHYTWGFQVEHGDFATSYIPQTLDSSSSVTRAADVYTSTPNLTETFEPRGLLIEEARTNLATKSHTPYGNDWVRFNLGGPTVSQITPLGTTEDVSQLTEDSTTNSHYKYHNTVPSTSSSAKCLSIFAKPLRTDRDLMVRLIGIGGGGPFAIFDLNTGLVTANAGTSGTSANAGNWTMGTPFIEKYANGWYRIGLTNVASFGAYKFGLYLMPKGATSENQSSFAGNGQASFAIYGPQYELGAFPTSYIHNTTSSSLTRSADVASISGDKFGTYRTNMFTKSEEFWDSSTWQGNGQITPYYALAPDGTFTAARYQTTPGTNTYLKQHVVLTGGKTYKFSVYVKDAGNSSDFNLYFYQTNNGAYIKLGKTTAPSDWQRFEFTVTPSSNSTVHVGFTTHPYNYSTDVLLWGAQLEESSTTTNYIPSTDTFTNRLSNATYVDSNGLIKTSWKNRLTRTDLINGWTVYKTNRYGSTGELSPFGTTEGVVRIVPTATGDNIVYYGTNGGVGTLSIYAKAEQGYTHLSLISQAASGSEHSAVNFDIVNGTITDLPTNDPLNATGEIIDVGNGWFRCIVRITNNETSGFFVINPHDGSDTHMNHLGRFDTATTSNTSILVYGPVYTDSLTEVGEHYLHNLGSASAPPRYSHDPETLVPTGLYLEPATTNYWHYSNLFTFDGFGGVNGMYMYSLNSTANAATAPDGTLTAASVIPKGNLSGGNNYWMQQQHLQGTAGSTFSCFIKYNGWRYVAIRNGHVGSPNDKGALFDILNGTLVHTMGGAIANIETYPNGWYRISCINLSAGNGWASIVFRQNDAFSYGAPQYTTPNDGVSGVYLWGIQWEPNPYPTSVIISSGNDTTRAADTFTSTATTVLDRDGGNKEAFYNQGGSRSVFVNYGKAFNNYDRIFAFKPSGNSDAFIQWDRTDNGKSNLRFRSNTGDHTFEVPADKLFNKTAFGFDDNNSGSAGNGVLGTTSTSLTLPTTTDSLRPLYMRIGMHMSQNSGFLNNSISRLTFWKTRLPDSSLINITT